MLYMLSSRSKRNIGQAELDFIEKSGSIDDFNDFFKDQGPKQLFEIILEHFVYCIKKKACTQKDAEYLLIQCVINFKSTDFEQNFIRSYLSDALKRGLGVVEAPTPRVEEKKQETPKESDTSMT